MRPRKLIVALKRSHACSVQNARQSIRRLSLLDEEIEEIESIQLAALRSSAASQVNHVHVLSERSGPLDAVDHAAEPTIAKKSDITKWLVWAKHEARLYATLVHPHRMQYKDPEMRARSKIMRSRGEPTSNDDALEQGQLEAARYPLACSHDELMDALGVGVRLYFDLLRFLLGFAVLGVLAALPSFIASFTFVYGSDYDEQDSRYDVHRIDFPRWFAVATLGARVSFFDTTNDRRVGGCETERCKTLNLLTAGLDSLFCLVFFFGVRAFRRYAVRLAEVDDAISVRVEDYSVVMYGLEGLMALRPHETCKPADIKQFVETALQEHAQTVHQTSRDGSMAAKWGTFAAADANAVWNVTLIADDRGLLRDLIANVPLERLVYTLTAREHRQQLLGRSIGCWQRRQLRQAVKRRDAARYKVDVKSAIPLEIVGAVVTFNDERGKQAALSLWNRSGLGSVRRPPPAYAHMPVVDRLGRTSAIRPRRLFAFAAPPPADVQYENMAVRFRASTACRRCLSFTAILLLIILALAISITLVTVSNLSDYLSVLLRRELEANNLTLAEATVANVTGGVNATLGANSTLVPVVATCTPAEERAINAFVGDPFDFLVDVYHSVTGLDGTRWISPPCRAGCHPIRINDPLADCHHCVAGGGCLQSDGPVGSAAAACALRRRGDRARLSQLPPLRLPHVYLVVRHRRHQLPDCGRHSHDDEIRAILVTHRAMCGADALDRHCRVCQHGPRPLCS